MSKTNGTGLAVGVIGVGSMGQHHARIYSELSTANLTGIFDVDDEQAEEIADKHDTEAMGLDDLLRSVSAVSIAVPTEFHFDIAKQCLEAGVTPLIEKPVVDDLEEGRELQRLAKKADIPVQVGHVERFNPVIKVLQEIVEDLDILALDAKRLGPPPSRDIKDSAILDLMIHDIDIILSLVDTNLASVTGSSAHNEQYGVATLGFDSDAIATLSASRITQQKVRTLEITAEDCVVEVDFIDQSIEIHRQSMPAYVQENEGLRYRHESVIERPTVPSDEPLKNELQAFLDTVITESLPKVSLENGLRALEVTQQIEQNDNGESNPLSTMVSK